MREYLVTLRRDLAELSLDLQCRPFTDDPGAPELVIAVDWSEVNAYLAGSSPPGSEAIVSLLGARLSNSIHNVSLTVLFERLRATGIPVLVLPPYVREMTRMLFLLNTFHVADELNAAGLDQIMKTLNSDALPKLQDIARQIRSSGLSPTTSEFLDRIQSIHSDILVEWLRQDFSDLFLLARFSFYNMLDVLKSLLATKGSNRSVFRTLADLDPTLAAIVKGEAAHIPEWEARIPTTHSDKTAIARRNDAEALASLSMLNGLLHGKRRQLLFVTRDSELRRIIHDDPGLFACLGDQYIGEKPLAQNTLILRSWTYFFQLGMAWDARVPGDWQRARRFAEAREGHVEVLIQSLENAPHDANQVYAKIKRDTDRDLKNLQSLLSLERPLLPRRQRRDRLESLAVQRFIAYVTDPVAFKEERRRIRDELFRNMQEVERTLPLAEATDPFTVSFPASFKPLTQGFLEKLPDAITLSDVSDGQVKDYLRGLHASIIARTRPDRIAELSAALSSGDRNSNAAIPSRDYTRLAMTVYYSLGAFSRLRRLLSTAKDTFSHAKETEVLTPTWALARLMDADAWVACNDAAERADGVLRQAVETALSRKEQDAIQRPIALALLNSWLLLHLDRTEAFGDNAPGFPPHLLDPQRTMLEHIVETLNAYIPSVPLRILKANPLLWRSVCNNSVYAVARLAPTVAIDSSPDRRWLDLLTSDTVKGRLAHLRKLRAKTIAELDTLAYYLMKLAYWTGLDSRRGRMLLTSARQYLDRAMVAVEESGDERAKHHVTRHRFRLAELNSFVEPLFAA